MASITELALTLEEIGDARRRIAAPELGAASHALAERDWCCSRFGDQTAADRIVLLVEVWTLIAADDLIAASALIRGGAPRIAIPPLLRAALEHLAWADWLLDPDAKPDSRAARAALVELDSRARDVTAVKRLAGADRTAGLEAERLLRDAESSVSSIGKVLRKGGRMVLLGESLPSWTEAVDRLGSRISGPDVWAGIYNWFSAVGTHPSMAVVSTARVERRVDVTDDILERLVRVAAVAALSVFEGTASYFGWDAEEVAFARSKAAARLP